MSECWRDSIGKGRRSAQAAPGIGECDLAGITIALGLLAGLKCESGAAPARHAVTVAMAAIGVGGLKHASTAEIVNPRQCRPAAVPARARCESAFRIFGFSATIVAFGVAMTMPSCRFSRPERPARERKRDQSARGGDDDL